MKNFENTKITVKFSDGRVRKYELFSESGNTLLEGSTAILKFRHPNFEEFFEAEILKEKPCTTQN